MPIKPILIISLILITGFKSYAQNGGFWAFGNHAGINFNTNPPTPVYTSINTNEGCASICDDNGHLLFYTDGTSVWDRNNNLMPNGKDLLLLGIYPSITKSTAQGALIVPVPANAAQYYIFSLGNWEYPTYFGRLYYSIVDMSLNNGSGDVLQKGTLLDTALTEHMMAVSGNDCNVWLIVVSRLNNDFKAYNIDVNGIDLNPVISHGKPEKKLKTTSEMIGTIDIAPNRRKLAIAEDRVILYDFDPGSGKITHPVVLLDPFLPFPDYRAGFYGVCFSPDNTKLYASLLTDVLSGDSMGLYQFDLSSNDSTTIVQSKTLISHNPVVAIKRAPDGKIYAVHSREALSVINQPNLAGIACQFVAEQFPLLPGTASILGLPNQGTIFMHKRIHSSTTDSTLCSGPRTLQARNISGWDYVWEDSTVGATREVNSPGVYWVQYKIPLNSPCLYEIHTDTFRVAFRFTSREVYTTNPDSGMCAIDTTLMQANDLRGTNYIWEDGSKGKQQKTNQTGIYWVSYQIDSICESHADTFIITYPGKDYEVSFHVDTLSCQNEPVYFQNTSDPHFNHFNWSFGDQGVSDLISPQHIYLHPGSYPIRLIGRINDICPDTTFHTIIVDSIFTVRFLTDRDSICTGEAIAFKTSTDSTLTNLTWQFGDGNELNGLEEHIHHAYDHSAGRTIVTLSGHFRACQDTSFTDTIYVFDPPKVYLGSDTSLCLNGAPIILVNQVPAPTIPCHNLWNTGDTTANLKVVHPGTYSLTVSTEPLDCRTTESVTISKDCYIDIPNAFTPNGDGENDYFFPRQLLSKKITRFKMQVFNRWGQIIFETNKTDGRGWDGQFNGKEQLQGVYVYVIDATIDGSLQEHYQGNVTLLR